ncbi:CD209 antigen-like protein C [Salmo trutta]|uniref:C-type lectin domain family 4 member E-like n=1 Tax=Salmo trutta TaxID=8032 RepID=A0A673YUS6_SALTR|nr:CD209 antigen-like protein C [Salmo trutta]
MSEAIYAMPDMTKKVKFDRSKAEERIVDIYVGADTLRDHETSTKTEDVEHTSTNGPGDQHTEPDSTGKRPFLAVAVCLGLLCVLLLAGIIGQSVHCRQQTRYNLSKEGDVLQTRHNNLTKERDQLQTRHNNLTKERDQLQTRHNNLTKERDQLQTRYNNLTKERDQLQREKDDFMEKSSNPSWNKFESCWYFVSTERKTWSESRKDCVARGADLVIINSRKEQRFLFALNKRVWIGLTDRETEGFWKWVDGTPLITRYWVNNQPNNGGSVSTFPGEDCVGLRDGQGQPEKTWNDLNCAEKRNWICELCNNNLL